MENSRYAMQVPHQPIQQDGSQERAAEVLMAIDGSHDNVIGCSFFNISDEILHVAQDIPRSDLDLLEHFAALPQPTLVLLSSRAPRQLLGYVQRCISSDQQRIRVVASVDFSASSAREKLCSWGFDVASELHLPGIDLCLQRDQIGCVSAILSELRRQSYLEHTTSTGSRNHRIRSVKVFCLTAYVLCSAETLQSLQIFPAEPHSKGQSWGIRGTAQFEMQNVSLYNLLKNLAHTPQGKVRLRAFLRSPLSNLGIIESRQRAICLLLDHQRRELLQEMVRTLKKVRNVKLCVDVLRKGVDRCSMIQNFGGSVWSNIRGFVMHALKLGDQIDAASRIHRQSLTSIGEILHRTVDFDQTDYDVRPSIVVGVDPQLDRMRRDYDALGSFLGKTALSVMHQVPEWAASRIKSCIFLPHVGFLVAVEVDADKALSPFPLATNNDDIWEEFFVADGAVHYKNNRMRHLDAQFGDIYRDIADREVEVLHRLATHVLHYDEALLEASDACGDVDAIVALALAADKYKWAAPRMTTDRVIRIRNGRHPIQELTVPSFIPNDCDLFEEQERRQNPAPGRCMIVTGPNSSGKSIYLKQVALIVYLAHVGSFVPAERAEIGITDRILTRITTRESANGQDSAFAIDLKQLHYAMTHMTPRSLLIIDEFGKGTNPEDGAGLLASLLEQLRSMRSNTPRCLVATHLCEIFDTNGVFSAQGFHLSYMDVIQRNQEADAAAHSITYLFKLRDGYRADSLGGYCATMNGVPSQVMNRAHLLSGLLMRHEDISISCARLSVEEEKTLQLAEGVARRFIEEVFDGQPAGKGSGVQHARSSLQRIFTTTMERLER
ncbi:hypothetical protein E4U42_003322 [Claviceps africana]|uniref:DNA mismatch repair protein MSH5 n=1 Tax=Claviceps africana TaxID=83212 RepID=A0A8K0JI66_9HYPO|nr:hypothetical protein E4U42_003322 [Claviceps africana]